MSALLLAGYCESYWCRLKGLMLRRALGEQQGLLLVQKGESRWGAAIHMFGMRFGLAVVWVDQQGQVVDLCQARPWRAWLVPRAAACYVLEAHPSRLDEFRIGDRLSFEEISAA